MDLLSENLHQNFLLLKFVFCKCQVQNKNNSVRKWQPSEHLLLLHPAKTNLQDHARLYKNLACKTCLARARDMSLFLHDSCTILHDSCTILHISCKKFCERYWKNNWSFLHFFCKILQELMQDCAKRDISRARAEQVLHARFLQDSCTILHA